LRPRCDRVSPEIGDGGDCRCGVIPAARGPSSDDCRSAGRPRLNRCAQNGGWLQSASPGNRERLSHASWGWPVAKSTGFWRRWGEKPTQGVSGLPTPAALAITPAPLWPQSPSRLGRW
jgi:hypothetical protein